MDLVDRLCVDGRGVHAGGVDDGLWFWLSWFPGGDLPMPDGWGSRGQDGAEEAICFAVQFSEGRGGFVGGEEGEGVLFFCVEFSLGLNVYITEQKKEI